MYNIKKLSKNLHANKFSSKHYVIKVKCKNDYIKEKFMAVICKKNYSLYYYLCFY